MDKTLGPLGGANLTKALRLASQHNRARAGTPRRTTPQGKIDKLQAGAARAREASKNNGRKDKHTAAT